MGDFTYRTREEVEEWKARCPIESFRRVVVAGGGVVTAAELEAVNEPVVSINSVPPLTTVGPVYVFVVGRISVPAPNFVRLLPAPPSGAAFARRFARSKRSSPRPRNA